MSFSCECGNPIPKIALDYAIEGKLIRCTKCGISLKLGFKNAAPFMPTSTITDAREHLNMNIEKGLPCPVCDQFCKLYNRKINTGMARWLLEVVIKFGDSSWFDIKQTSARGGDYGKLRYWGIIEAGSESRSQGGKWRITEQGISFAMGVMRMPRNVYVRNNEAKGFSEDTISIQEALGDKFDYDELMS